METCEGKGYRVIGSALRALEPSIWSPCAYWMKVMA